MRWIFFLLFSFPIWGVDDVLFDWKKISNSPEGKKLITYLDCEIQKNFQDSQCEGSLEIPAFQKLGIFITFLSKNTVRGCYGAYEHRSDSFIENLQIYVKGAMNEDPRYPAIQKSEWKELGWKLTIAGELIRVQNLDRISMYRRGFYLVTGMQNFVYVPGELKTIDELKKIVKDKKIQEIYYFQAVVLQKKKSG